VYTLELVLELTQQGASVLVDEQDNTEQCNMERWDNVHLVPADKVLDNMVGHNQVRALGLLLEA
jgi:hypothetical protein